MFSSFIWLIIIYYFYQCDSRIWVDLLFYVFEYEYVVVG